MRYEARYEQIDDLWIVFDTKSGLEILAGDEPVARIIEFSLNAVSSGKRLAAMTETEWMESHFTPDVPDAYYGPTEGVVP